MRPVIPIKQVGTQEAGKDAGGWERVSTLSEPLLTKMVENYKALGYEVEVREMQRAEGGCNTCFDAGAEIGQAFGTLFVRRAAAEREDDELFD